MSTLTPQAETHPHYWLGTLATVIGEAARMSEDKRTRNYLQSKLAEFIVSPVPSEELRGYLREYLR